MKSEAENRVVPVDVCLSVCLSVRLSVCLSDALMKWK